MVIVLILSHSVTARSNSNSSLVFPAFDRQILQPIGALKTVMRDNNIRFRTFICLSMSKGMFTAWLEALPKQRSELIGSSGEVTKINSQCSRNVEKQPSYFFKFLF